MADDSQRVPLGKIGRPHGVHGEVRIFPFNPDSDTLRPGLTVYLTGDGPEQALTVESARHANKFILVRFQGLNHRDQIDAFKHRIVEIDAADLPELDDDEFYHRDLLGAPVFVAAEEDGELPDTDPIGTVDRFFETGANDVLVVHIPDGKPLMVPFIPEAISFVDLDDRIVVLQPLELWTPQ